MSNPSYAQLGSILLVIKVGLFLRRGTAGDENRHHHDPRRARQRNKITSIKSILVPLFLCERCSGESPEIPTKQISTLRAKVPRLESPGDSATMRSRLYRLAVWGV